MNKTLSIALATCLLSLSGCASMNETSSAAEARKAEAAQALQTALAGFKPGKPRSCIALREAESPKAYGDSLVFTVGRNLLYHTDTKGGCSGVNRGDALLLTVHSSELCRGDPAKTADLQAGFTSGFCVMGDFVPYTRN